MRSMFWLPVVILLLTASPGRAQDTSGVGGPFAPAVQPPVDPFGSRFVTPGLPSASTGFESGFDPRVQPFPFSGSFGDPFLWYGPYGYVPAYGPLYSGPLVNNLGIWESVNQPLTFGYQTMVPIAGLNSPPIGRQVRMNAPAREFRRTVTPRAASSARPNDGEIMVPAAEIDPQQVRLAARLEDTMETRPLLEGEIERVGATGVVVRYRTGSQVVSQRFPHGNVYFFQDERLATGLTNPELLQPGMSVLIPRPASVRDSVAGTREETPEVRPVPVPDRTPIRFRAAPRAPGSTRGSRRPAR